MRMMAMCLLFVLFCFDFMCKLVERVIFLWCYFCCAHITTCNVYSGVHINVWMSCVFIAALRQCATTAQYAFVQKLRQALSTLKKTCIPNGTDEQIAYRCNVKCCARASFCVFIVLSTRHFHDIEFLEWKKPNTW